ncbi:MAG: hypothetical protein H7Z42_10345 [Roseiflexaceae bacterium]|nr:hypothetical protein [Roseiflexaceae bacterium]
MTLQTTSRTHQRLLEIAREYRQNGYEVIIEPEAQQLPIFLAHFKVDLLARSQEENVIVEVRTQESLTNTPELDALAKALEDKSSWRLELVVTNPKDQTALPFRNATSLTKQDISYRLREARQLSDQEHGEAAFLLAWSATEALLRQMVEIEGVPAVQHQTSQVVKTLYVHGVIDKTQYTLLQEGQHTRNIVVHGYKEKQNLTPLFDQLLHLTQQLAQQHLLSQ